MPVNRPLGKGTGSERGSAAIVATYIRNDRAPPISRFLRKLIFYRFLLPSSPNFRYSFFNAGDLCGTAGHRNGARERASGQHSRQDEWARCVAKYATSPLPDLMKTRDRLLRKGDRDVSVSLCRSSASILPAKARARTEPRDLAELTDEKGDEKRATLTTIRGIGIADENKCKDES